MEKILSQIDIDELIIAVNNGTFDNWKPRYDNRFLKKERFQSDEFYMIENYDLFYCCYKIETITSDVAVIRRYAYGDNISFKRFSHFIVLEDYFNIGINIVSVIGVPENEVYGNSKNNYYNIQHAPVYLVDASSLSHNFVITV